MTTTTSKRQKQVFNTSEVPHIWAHQSQHSGRNQQGNIYFEGKTIYSYGRHFPIATMEGNDVLFTMQTYSNTTAKHIWKVRAAISHKNIIYCYEVPESIYSDKPINKQPFTSLHEKNLRYWKGQLNELFTQLGNKRIRDISGRVNEINRNIAQLQAYCSYFKIPVKDKELKSLVKLAQSPDFLQSAREAKEKKDAAQEKKLQQAKKAYDQYLSFWREFDTEGIKELPDNIKELANYYQHHSGAFTRLRFNRDENRVETSKGVQIPVEVAKRAYLSLNGCIEGTCNDLSIPVLGYTITRTTKEAIIAGCHTIPKTDVQYIANLLNWTK